jgi:hypothetical protein
MTRKNESKTATTPAADPVLMAHQVHTLAHLMFQQLAASRWPAQVPPWFATMDPYRAAMAPPMSAWAMPTMSSWNIAGAMPAAMPGMMASAVPQSFVYWYP